MVSKHALGIVLLFVFVAAATGGCRFLSGDDEVETPFFAATVNGTELSGTSIGRLAGGDLHVWAQFVHPDSTFRFLQFTVPDFEGAGEYPLPRRMGSYGAIMAEDELDRYGYSAGFDDDVIVIDAYDERRGVIRGRLFFYAQAVIAFEGVLEGDAFTVSGRFRAELR